MKTKEKDVIAGFKFETSGGHERSGDICQIVSRAGTDSEQIEEPRFTVEFGDGEQMDAMASELSPWFPT